MSQRDRARAIIDSEFEFVRQTALTPEAVSRAALDAAEHSKSLRGSIKNLGGKIGDDGTHLSSFALSGPGGFVQVMDFVVVAEPLQSGSSKVALRVGDFLFQKGALGTKPTINGKPVISKFVQLLQSALS